MCDIAWLIALLQLLWQRSLWGRGVAIACGVAIALTIGWIDIDRYSDSRPRADQAALPNYADSEDRTMATYRNWLRVCEWIKNNTPADAQFITPDQQQTFKWYAQRAEVVNWKDVPQDAQAMVDWRGRVGLLIDPQRSFEFGLMERYSDLNLRGLGSLLRSNAFTGPAEASRLAN